MEGLSKRPEVKNLARGEAGAALTAGARIWAVECGLARG